MHRKVQFCHQVNSVVFAVSSPCSENNGGCEQLCFSFPNRTEPKCQCATGVLDKNGKSCNGIFLNFISFYYAFANLLCFDFFE